MLREQQMKSAYWLAAACLVTSLPAYANAGFKPIEIKDQELSELRGRYVMPGRIISFGIVMSSTWRNASGDLIGATTSMQIQQSTIKPEFYVSTITETGNGSTPTQGSGNVIGGAGLATTQGVTQSVRAAGDGNTAYNNLSIDVKEASHAPALVPAQGQLLMSGQTISGSNAAGSVAVSATGGGIQMAIQANNNQGSAVQQVAQGGLLQNTRLLGDSNLVSNMTQLNVVLNNNGASTGALDCNLTQLKGLRNLGY
ncbi:Fap system putative outer membrane protein [Pseudomonas chlororaphis subsp. aurantiaca]|nr:Fap system putative outer membrane protein [Pseudomonas chlororaphis subsp. aurantiaca]AZD42127.1 Fap system putative outer membrane protein [Pseudomonas chlororaphis subsp. aurantiaca]AZD54752.1 Fap system putative outer membrane protein [Pseudomonas chlororaphis subsp. aurantiaca]AZD60815.1 Fap system putative outer membrane protein [Pseudomonas chlororaphis subsp. aurantiaca]